MNVVISIEKIEIFPDPNTESILLPSWLQDNTNTVRLHHMKIALNMAIRTRLSQEQRDVLFWHYQQRKTKTEIGNRLGIQCPAVCKKIKSAQAIIKDYVEFYMATYDFIERENY